MRRGRWGWTLGLLVLGAGCGGSGPADVAAVRSEIARANVSLTEWYAQKKMDSIVALFLPDAEILNPNRRPITGQDSIRAYLGRLLVAGSEWSVNLTTERLEAAGPVAIERGRYRIALTLPGMTEPIVDSGHRLVAWRHTPDGWRVAYDMSASEIPRRQ
jgi:ketosteroid isomerase-like protein